MTTFKAQFRYGWVLALGIATAFVGTDALAVGSSSTIKVQSRTSFLQRIGQGVQFHRWLHSKPNGDVRNTYRREKKARNVSSLLRATLRTFIANHDTSNPERCVALGRALRESRIATIAQHLSTAPEAVKAYHQRLVAELQNF